MKLPKLRKGDLLEVEWKDHWSLGSGWYTDTEILREARSGRQCKSKGSFWGTTKDLLILFGTDDGDRRDTSYSNLQAIYRNHIVRVKKL